MKTKNREHEVYDSFGEEGGPAPAYVLGALTHSTSTPPLRAYVTDSM